MGTTKQNSYEKNLNEKLGNWLTMWYNSAPKTKGLHIVREVLEKFGAWQRFIVNFHNSEKRNGYGQVYEYILRTKDLHNLIEWAFVWESTSEGNAYWEDLNERVRIALNCNEAKGIDLKELSEEVKESTTIVIPPRKTRSYPARKNTTAIPNSWNSIYSLLGGAKSVNEFAMMLHGILPQERNEMIHLKMPVSSTTIISTSTIE